MSRIHWVVGVDTVSLVTGLVVTQKVRDLVRRTRNQGPE